MPSQEVPSQICTIFGPNLPLFAENNPGPWSKQPNKEKQLQHLTCCLTSLYEKSLLVRSDSTICPRNTPKVRQKSPDSRRTLVADSPKPRTSRILGYMAQNATPTAPLATTSNVLCSSHPRPRLVPLQNTSFELKTDLWWPRG